MGRAKCWGWAEAGRHSQPPGGAWRHSDLFLPGRSDCRADSAGGAWGEGGGKRGASSPPQLGLTATGCPLQASEEGHAPSAATWVTLAGLRGGCAVPCCPAGGLSLEPLVLGGGWLGWHLCSPLTPLPALAGLDCSAPGDAAVRTPSPRQERRWPAAGFVWGPDLARRGGGAEGLELCRCPSTPPSC